MNLFSYNGPVMVFDTCVASNWKASTFAVTEQKARSNLAYQYKKKNNKVPNTKVTLPGKLEIVR